MHAKIQADKTEGKERKSELRDEQKKKEYFQYCKVNIVYTHEQSSAKSHTHSPSKMDKIAK